MDCFILRYKRGSIQHNLRTRKMKKTYLHVHLFLANSLRVVIHIILYLSVE